MNCGLTVACYQMALALVLTVLMEPLGFRIQTSAVASPPIAAPFKPGSGIT